MEWTIARDRWQQHLKTRGQYYIDWADRLEAVHLKEPENGAHESALGLRALAALLERCRLDRLTRSQHLLFRLGELISAAETAAVFSERVVQHPPELNELDTNLRQTLARINSRQAMLKIASDGLAWANACGQSDPNLGERLYLAEAFAAQVGQIHDMDCAAARLAEIFIP